MLKSVQEKLNKDLELYNARNKGKVPNQYEIIISVLNLNYSSYFVF